MNTRELADQDSLHLTQNLPAFDPAEHSLEPELALPIPRPLPPAVSNGPHARRIRTKVVVLIVLGLLAITLSQVDSVHRGGDYLLPLRYLDWLGLALIFASLVTWFEDRRSGPLRFVRDGVALSARVREITLVPVASAYGQVTHWAYQVVLDVLDPLSGALSELRTQSHPVWSDAKDKLTTSFVVGDYVTAVYLPPDVSTVRLYPLLGLKDGVGIIDRPGVKHSSRTNMIVSGVSVAALIAVAFWNIVAFDLYAPLRFSDAQGWTIAAGAVLLGNACLLAIFMGRYREQARRVVRNAEARATGLAVELEPNFGGRLFGGRGWLITVMLGAGSLLVGGLTALCWGWTLNAVLDSSPAERRPIMIRDAFVETTNFVLRTYKVEFEFEGDNEKHSYGTTPAVLSQLRQGEAVALVRAGRFGWEWVAGIAPPGSTTAPTVP